MNNNILTEYRGIPPSTMKNIDGFSDGNIVHNDRGKKSKIGVLMVNLGSPESPTYTGLFKYLAEFLSDTRVIETSRWLWYPMLYGFILPFRSKASADKYKKVWTPEGSPLVKISRSVTEKVADKVQARYPTDRFIFSTAMRYGSPSVSAELKEMRAQGVQKLLVIPMYPQQSAATVGSVADAVFAELMQWRTLPELRLITNYYSNPVYIQELSKSIKSFWEKNGRGDKLIVSFHGMPAKTWAAGDSYACSCSATCRLLEKEMGVSNLMVYQSRFGPAEWLQPYCEDVVEELGQDVDVGMIDVVSPGFAVDCLETIDEIGREYKEQYEEACKKSNKDGHLRYIPALNDEEGGVRVFESVVDEGIQGWVGK